MVDLSYRKHVLIPQGYFDAPRFITGENLTQIPNPPMELLTQSPITFNKQEALDIIARRDFIFPGVVYFPDLMLSVGISGLTHQFNWLSDLEMGVIDPKLLLNPDSRHLYGYQETEDNCFDVATQAAYPGFVIDHEGFFTYCNQDLAREMDGEVDFESNFHEQFVQVETPQFGDVCVLLRGKQMGPYHVRNYEHAWMHVTPDLVFSKNGTGATSGFYVQPFDRMLQRYVLDGEIREKQGANVSEEILIFRPKYLLDG